MLNDAKKPDTDNSAPADARMDWVTPAITVLAGDQVEAGYLTATEIGVTAMYTLS